MKKKWMCTTLVSLVVCSMANTVEGKNPVDLSKYRWKHRLLLVYTPAVDAPGYVKLERDLSSQEEEVLDRDLLIFHILENAETKVGNSALPQSSGDYLREKYSINSGTFIVLLIGKDGNVKLRREGRVELDEIFSLIDAMPMRKREMRENSAPNYVSSMSDNTSHYVAPLTYKASVEEAREKLISVITSMKRSEIVSAENNYLHATFKSFIFRFVDDVEFFFDEERKIIHVRSASRKGYSDLGVNRRRVEEIRRRFIGR